MFSRPPRKTQQPDDSHGDGHEAMETGIEMQTLSSARDAGPVAVVTATVEERKHQSAEAKIQMLKAQAEELLEELGRVYRDGWDLEGMSLRGGDGVDERSVGNPSALHDSDGVEEEFEEENRRFEKRVEELLVELRVIRDGVQGCPGEKRRRMRLEGLLAVVVESEERALMLWKAMMAER